MFFLSPAKLLIIAVVALAVLGPDTLPKVAKQIGGFWGEFTRFRQKLESEVRGSFPNLPSSEIITRAVRSPLSVLDTLADAHAAGPATPSDGVGTAASVGTAAGSDPVPSGHHGLTPTPGAPDDPGLH